MFNKVLTHFLELGECLEADDGYVGRVDKFKCPKKSGQSAGEAGYAGEGKNASLDTGWMAQELGDSCPGLPPPHLTAWRCVPGVHGVGVTQLTTEKGRFSR